MEELLAEILAELREIRVQNSVIFQLLRRLTKRSENEMAKLSDVSQEITTLQASVAKQNTVIGSAVTLLNGISGQLATANQQLADALANQDPVAIQAAFDNLTALQQGIDGNSSTLANAVAANTPASTGSGSSGSGSSGGNSGSSGSGSSAGNGAPAPVGSQTS